MAKKRKRKLAKHEGPACHCLILCDDIIKYHASGKMSITGVIGQIAAVAIPGVLARICLFVRITNVLAEETVTVTFMEAKSQEVLWQFKATLPASEGPNSGPLLVHTIATRIPPFVVKHAGLHLLTIAHGGVPFADATVLIVDAGPVHEATGKEDNGD